MKVIVLAGGMGTRLGQQSEIIPKPMVLIGNKPILWHVMKIYSCQGFCDFVICLGEKGHVIKEYFSQYGFLNKDFTVEISSGNIEYHSNHSENNWRVTLVDTGQDTLKGGRIKRIEKYLDSETNMLTYGDGLADIDLKKLLKFHKSHGKIVTITAVHRPSSFGKLDEDSGQVLSFSEKPQISKGLINGGFMVFNKELLDYLSEDKSCDFEFGSLEELAKKGQVMAYKHEGSWECVDHERDLVFVNNLWKTGEAFWKMW